MFVSEFAKKLNVTYEGVLKLTFPSANGWIHKNAKLINAAVMICI